VLQERKVAQQAAHAIVAAFVQARLGTAPLPVDTVELLDSGSSGESLPGYRYETPRLAPGPSIDAGDRTIRALARAERPVLAVLDGVIDAAECEELIAMARGRLKPSTVTDATTGRDVIARQRTSFGMFFRPFQNPLVAGIDRRIARIMYLNDVAQGGETIFPATGWTVSPVRGHAVYFEYCNSLGELDHASLHASRP